MPRKPIVAGQFYEDSFDKLDRQITQSFESDFGPATTPNRRENKDIFGIISPHAGYAFSGPCAAWGFKEIAESEFPDTYIILGLGHSGQSSSVSLQDWETPIGLVKNDTILSQKIIDKGIPNDEKAHSTEHSIEVQLPFLQFASKDNLNNLNIVPIIVSEDYKEIAKIIKQALEETNTKACFIASSDFTHYGFNYGFMPFMRDVKENLYNLDRLAIEEIKKLSSESFLDYIKETNATICGKYPISCLIELANLYQKNKVQLLRYYTSGDIVDDYSNAVGYASIMIK
jgi:hypothetical protein